jgi:hypothetical protein
MAQGVVTGAVRIPDAPRQWDIPDRCLPEIDTHCPGSGKQPPDSLPAGDEAPHVRRPPGELRCTGSPMDSTWRRTASTSTIPSLSRNPIIGVPLLQWTDENFGTVMVCLPLNRGITADLAGRTSTVGVTVGVRVGPS